MSDPFANLINTFKGGATNAPQKQGSPAVENGESGQKQSPKPGKLLHDDFDELFGLRTNTKDSNGSAPVTSDPFDVAFDAFDESLAAGGVETRQEAIETEPVVDEVRDMEIARLMSLGLSFEEASKLNEEGVSYEEMVRRQKASTQRHVESPQRRIEKAQPDFFNTATAWMNKGRAFLDAKFKQMQSDNSSETFGDYLKSRSPDPELRDSPFSDYGDRDLTARNFVEDDHRSSVQCVSLSSHSTPVPSPEPAATDVFATTKSQKKESEEQTQPESLLVDFETASPSEIQNKSASTGLSQIEAHSFEEFRTKGTQAFTDGDYANALSFYTKSLNTLPPRHALRVISLSNIMATQLKIGEYRKVIENSEDALDVIGERSLDEQVSVLVPNKDFKSFWAKIMLRRAEALEHIEDYGKALEAYQLLISKGLCTPKIMDGRRRCQKILNPEKFKASASPAPERQTSKRTGKRVSPSSVSYDSKLATVKALQQKERDIADQRADLQAKIESRISQWTKGNVEDLRILLTNLSEVLDWCDWKPVDPASIVMPKKVKIVYLKAAAKTHPDKIQDSWPLERKMMAENIFVVLNKAWEQFKEENGIN
ncbi:LAMI_0C09120g1_1 [Lachancea mirantina]|uniref:LAMI_0C09120g1_1 n=1 Tax=Lachancea mirantina TaxID=1230905 RepID=A0A1G4J5A5_9SACH|nr:LAMI_0C09120g1_1 [Lachancea mirantina]